MTYDVIIIGGGLTGSAAAHYLALDGVPSLLLEQADLNSAASGFNAGSLHLQIPHDPFMELGDDWARRFSAIIPLLQDSIALWERAGEETGEDLEIRTPGGILIADTDAQMRDLDRKAQIERAAGLEPEILSPADLRDRMPYLSTRLAGGLFCAGEGKANPLISGPAFARSAARNGADIRRGVRVRHIEREDGQYAVHTDHDVFRTRHLINAAGAAVSEISEMLGMRLDVQKFPIQLSVTEPAEPFIHHLVYSAGQKLTLKQTPLGTVLIGGGWEADLDSQGRPVVNPDSLARNLGVALGAVPDLGSLNLIRTWAAFVNGNASWMPIIGEPAPGYYVSYVPWIGFTAGPMAGRIAADMAQRKPTETRADLSLFRP